MSLVAYDNSDDSDSSEVEDELQNHDINPSKSNPSTDSGSAQSNSTGSSQSTSIPDAVTKPDEDFQSTVNPQILGNPVEKINDTVSNQESIFESQISDEEDDFISERQTEVLVPSGLNLPPPKHSQNDSDMPENPSTGKSNPTSFLLDLPAPKSDAGPATSVASGEDELEDLVKPKAAELASREKPPPAAKKKMIKITAPSVNDYESDEDEDEPVKKKPKQSKGGSGLFALLPEPKNVSIKQAGRSLIPHTLTKKPTPVPKKPPPKPASKSIQSNITQKVHLPGVPVDEDSEDEEGTSQSSGNFFSIEGDITATNDIEKTLLSASSYSVTSSLSTLPAVARQPHKKSVSESDANKDNVTETDKSTESDLSDEPLIFKSSALADAPLQFKTGTSSFVGPQLSSSRSYVQEGATAGASHGSSYEPQLSNEAYNLAGSDETQLNPDTERDPEILPAVELLRLQGKKQWGKEAMNIIDVRADDMTNTLDLTKNLTEEVDMVSHSKKNKKDGPTTQQRRKHQITYLAHQAKEREFDLKNQWANNRVTKKQTQSKYGF